MYVHLSQQANRNVPFSCTLIHSCVVIFKQPITDPPLNTDILNIILWPLITDIHSLTYCNNPHNSWKSSIFIFNWEVRQKCRKSLQNSGKYSTTVEFHVFEIHTLNANNETAEKYTLFSKISWNWYPKRGARGLRWCIKKNLFPRFFARGWQHD